jgi:S1-C subfamily serine protease
MSQWLSRSAGRFLVLIVAALALDACTYDAPLEKSFYKPKQRFEAESEKVDLKVGVVKDQELRDLKFSESDGFYGVEIDVGNSVAEAVRAELSTIFTRVAIVEDTSGGDFDAYAYPSLEWETVYTDRRRGHFIYKVKFRLKLMSRARKYTIAKYDAAGQANYEPPPAAFMAQVLQGATLFLLTPVTAPMTTQAVGAEAKRVIGEVIGKSVKAVGDHIVKDGDRFREYAMTLQGGEHETSPVQTAKRNPRYKKARSKYDDFLNGVVVIRNADGIGTGFFVSSDGYIVTNKHVVGAEDYVSVKIRSGQVLVAKLVRTSPARDLALIKVEGKGFTWLQLSGGEDAGVGNDVLAIGTPKGLSWSVSKGIISAVRDLRNVRMIQTDAAINSGNSGGPLIDLRSGKVVGVNSLTIRKDIAEGLNFAVSSEDVLRAFNRYLGK